MVRRLLTVSLLSFAVAVSSAGVLAAEAATPAAPTVAVPATQVSNPGLYCGAGVVGTVCSAVLAPICKDRCGVAATPAESGAVSATTAQRSAAVAPRAGAAATTAQSTPTITCAEGFEVVCTVLGLTVCRKDGCALDGAATTTSSPAIDCDIQLICLILALTVCRNGCAIATDVAAEAPAVELPPNGLCTVNIRPTNPFCLVP